MKPVAFDVRRVAAETFGVEVPGMVALKAGDVVNVHGGLHMVVRVSESNARVQPAKGKERTVTDRLKDTTKTFTTPAESFPISNQLPRELLVERQGDSGLAYFLANRAVRGCEDHKQKTKQATADTENDSMAAKKKTAAKGRKAKNIPAPEAAAGEPTSKGKLGNIMGYSTCAVLRRLGSAEVTVPHAKAIVKALGVKASDTTVAINISAGSRGKGSLAPLTKEQVAELKATAPAPEPAEKPAK